MTCQHRQPPLMWWETDRKGDGCKTSCSQRFCSDTAKTRAWHIKRFGSWEVTCRHHSLSFSTDLICVRAFAWLLLRTHATACRASYSAVNIPCCGAVHLGTTRFEHCGADKDVVSQLDIFSGNSSHSFKDGGFKCFSRSMLTAWVFKKGVWWLYLWF